MKAKREREIGFFIYSLLLAGCSIGIDCIINNKTLVNALYTSISPEHRRIEKYPLKNAGANNGRNDVNVKIKIRTTVRTMLIVCILT